MSLPKKSFARKIINMRGYSNEEEIVEVACIDNVSHDEAARRVAHQNKEDAGGGGDTERPQAEAQEQWGAAIR
jgi:hypothetical protein